MANDLRAQFEAQASDPSFKFARSRKGTYVNPALARDWKWFQAGAAKAAADHGARCGDMLAAIQLMEDGEWAEHFAKSDLGRRLEAAITQLHSDLNDAQAPVAGQPAEPSPAWPKARDVGRFGDMSPDAHLRVGLDNDNDVYVSVWDQRSGATIEFCNPGGGGGGRSSRTRMALIALMVAMEADNADTPSLDWWALRMAAPKGDSNG